MVDLYLKSSEKRFVTNKDPNATLDYTWNWAEYLAPINDSISTFTISLDPTLTHVTSSVATGNRVIAYIAGGTLGQIHKATCRITTVGGRIDERSIFINIIDR